MGCGQSKLYLYSRKSKNKSNGKKHNSADVDADTDEEEGCVEKNDKDKQNGKERSENDSLIDGTEISDGSNGNGDLSMSLIRAKNLSLLHSQEISNSQQNFFRMLDQKISEGPDYDSSSETEMALEEARRNALIHHWESASLSASYNSSLNHSQQNTPNKQNTISRNMVQNYRGHFIGDDNLPQPHQYQIRSHYNQPNVMVKHEVPSIISQPTLHQSYGIPQSDNTTSSLMQPRSSAGILPPHLSIGYYTQPPPPPPQLYFGESLHSTQQSHSGPLFPPAISVQRLAPQVQRQLRETQELIKDSCQQMYTSAYGNIATTGQGIVSRSQPQPPPGSHSLQPLNVRQQSNVKTEYSSELS